MKDQTEQTKMYRLINGGYDSLEIGRLYEGSFRPVPLVTISDLVAETPDHWQLVEPEQNPFTPTHVITDGEYKNELVCETCGMADGRVRAKTRENEIIYVHMANIEPLPTKTQLSESQHQSLVKSISDILSRYGVLEQYRLPNKVNEMVREWAETNNIELP